MKQQLLTLLIALMASSGLMFAKTYSGTCGDNLKWTLNTDDGVLTISGTGAMSSYTSSSDVPWYSYSSSIKTVSIGNSVTSIGNYAFYGCNSLTSVTIPNSVTTIGNGAFSKCSGLTSVTIPNSVTTIGDYAFSNCSGLTSVTIPNNVTSIGNMAFEDCSSLTSVTIPNRVTSIGWWAFLSCSSLTSVTIPNSVTIIEWWAFVDCSKLISIDVAADNPNYCSVDGVLFDKNKTELIQYPAGKSAPSYSIPSSVTTIESAAFRSCSSLTAVTIPNSVTSIGDGAFLNCPNLTSITIPNSVTTIGYYTFDDCSKLPSIDVAADNPDYCSVDGVLFDKDKTTLIRYPAGKSATSYSIPNSVTTIVESAFSGYSCLTSVTIGNSVTNIGKYAFYNCSSLTSITCEAVNPPTLYSYVFYDVNHSVPLYVPAESIDAYKAADQWKDFTNIQPIQ